MFTGLVEEAGRVEQLKIDGKTARLTVRCASVHEGAKLGDSVAINGCCLTVVAIEGRRLTFEAIPETLDKTNLGSLVQEDRVNLERPVLVGSRLGGHIVQGHIDGVGVVIDIIAEENAIVLWIEAPSELRRYIVKKGSIAVDGVSLTVADVEGSQFSIWTIPHTREITTLGDRILGDRVNLECDLIGKYVESLVGAHAGT